jgi:hypothetical protein
VGELPFCPDSSPIHFQLSHPLVSTAPYLLFIFSYTIQQTGARQRSSLKRYDRRRKVAGSILMRSLHFSIDLALPAAIRNWVDSTSKRNHYQEFSWGLSA